MPMGEKTRLLWQDPEYRKRMSEAHKGKIHAGSFKEGHKVSNTGRTYFKKGENRITGENNFFYGKRFEEENHPSWKGDNVGYGGVHTWMRDKYGPANMCENKNCFYPRKMKNGVLKEKPSVYNWANIDGKYSRDRNTWRMMCISCHGILDRSKDKSFIQF